MSQQYPSQQMGMYRKRKFVYPPGRRLRARPAALAGGVAIVPRRRGRKPYSQLAKMEPHYRTIDLAATFTNVRSGAGSQYIDICDQIAQGDDVVDQRDGRQIYVKSMTIRGFIVNDGEDCQLRLCIYACQTSYTSSLLITDYLTPLRKNTLHQVYYDKGYNITTDDTHRAIPINIYLVINRMITYQSSAVSTNNDAVRIHAMSTAGVDAGPTFQGFASITYFG